MLYMINTLFICEFPIDYKKYFRQDKKNNNLIILWNINEIKLSL